MTVEQRLIWQHHQEPVLSGIEERARQALADPSNLLHANAQRLLNGAECVRGLVDHGIPHDVTFMRLIDLERRALDQSVQPIAVAARVGEKVINGGRRAAESTHGTAEERAETRAKRIKAFQQIRPDCKSDSEGFRRAGQRLGEDPQTIRRACKAGGIPLRSRGRS